MALINEKLNQFQKAAVYRCLPGVDLDDHDLEVIYSAMLNYAEFSTPVKVRLTMRRVSDLKVGDLIIGRVGGAIKKVTGVYPNAELGYQGSKWRIDFTLHEPNWNREGHDFRYPDFYYLVVKGEDDVKSDS